MNKTFTAEGDWRGVGVNNITVDEWGGTVRLEFRHNDEAAMTPDVARLVALALIKAADDAEVEG